MQIFTNDVIVEGTVDATGSAISVTNFPATQPVSGSISVSNFPATQPISGTVSVGNVVQVITAVASTATLTTTVISPNTSTLVLAANVNRKSAILFIPKATTSIKYGSGASATSFTTLTGAANTTIGVTGYTGDVYVFGPAQSVNATELV